MIPDVWFACRKCCKNTILLSITQNPLGSTRNKKHLILGSIYSSMWTGYVFFNLRFTTTDGDEIRFRDAVGNLIKSPAFQGTSIIEYDVTCCSKKVKYAFCNALLNLLTLFISNFRVFKQCWKTIWTLLEAWIWVGMGTINWQLGSAWWKKCFKGIF